MDTQVIWSRLAGRRGGKVAAARAEVREALRRGEHVHVATVDGLLCAGGSAECSLPRAGAPDYGIK